MLEYGLGEYHLLSRLLRDRSSITVCVCGGGGGLQNGVGGGASEVLPLYLTQELEVLPILRGHKTF